MDYDYSKLLGRIVEKCGTQLNFASAIGLSEGSVSLRLNRHVPWKDTEIVKAIEVLNISANDIPKYFFAQKVHERWTFFDGGNNV